MKTISTYFQDSVSAGRAASRLADFTDFYENIILKNKASESSRAFSYCVQYTLSGTFLGFIFGLFISLFSSYGTGFTFFTVAGILSGTVIGALTGCFIDLINFDYFPFCVELTVFVNKKDSGKVLNFLKKCGGKGTHFVS